MRGKGIITNIMISLFFFIANHILYKEHIK